MEIAILLNIQYNLLLLVLEAMNCTMRNQTIKIVLLSANFLMMVFALISVGARNYATCLINIIDSLHKTGSQPGQAYNGLQ